MSDKKLPIAVGVGAAALAGAGALVLANNPAEAPEDNGENREESEERQNQNVEDADRRENPERNEPTEPQESEDVMESEYEDGTYTAVGNYVSPAGNEEIGVTITLEDGKIASVETEELATNNRSINYQRLFSEGIEEEIVGEELEDVELEFINGSSLTPTGFNAALEEIKSEAKNS